MKWFYFYVPDIVDPVGRRGSLANRTTAVDTFWRAVIMSLRLPRVTSGLHEPLQFSDFTTHKKAGQTA